MNKLAILTDSTAYLPQRLIEEHPIHVIPLQIHCDETTYRDGVDLTPDQFYTKLSNGCPVPTTSQPAVGDFLEAYQELAQEYSGVLVILISSGISGTVDSALTAAEEVQDLAIEVVDSRITSAGLALIVGAAARAIKAGADLQQAAQTAHRVADRMHTYFVVDTLEYLHKGGRIGGASRYLGAALQIKPILTFDERGQIDALDRIRTKKKALDRLLELVQEGANGQPIHAGVVHAQAPEEAERLRSRLEDRFKCLEVETYELSPVIGTHVGPGTLGIAMYPDEQPAS